MKHSEAIDGSQDDYGPFLRTDFAQRLGWEPIFAALWQFEQWRPVHQEATRYTRGGWNHEFDE